MGHTQGKWEYSKRIDTGFRVHTIKGGMANAIADLDEWQTLDETEANARLIATAPELVGECKRALFFLIGENPSTIDKEKIIYTLKQAIKKAEGR